MMAAKQSKHNIYPFGASTLTINRVDEERRSHPAEVVAVATQPSYDDLLDMLAAKDALIADLQARLARRGIKPARKPSHNVRARGRHKAQTVVMQKGVTYYSFAHVATLAGIHTSNVSRQIAALGIKPTYIGGISYIPAAQAVNIKKRKK